MIAGSPLDTNRYLVGTHPNCCKRRLGLKNGNMGIVILTLLDNRGNDAYILWLAYKSVSKGG